MKFIIKSFLKGLLITAPVAITVYILYLIVSFADNLFVDILSPFGLYFPGIGLVLTLVIITLIGFLAANWFAAIIFEYIDAVFKRVPFVKTVYTTIKDAMASFTTGKKGFSQLAIVNIPHSDIKLLGFITNDNLEKFGLEGYISVYLMQSMQWAGNLILVPKEMVTVLDVSSEEAIKFIVSAGLIENNKN